MKKENISEKEAEIKTINTKWLFPIFITVAIIPVLVIAVRFKTGLEGYIWYGTNDTDVDFYLYAKSLVLTIMGAMAVIIMSYLMKTGYRPFKDRRILPVLIAAGVFTMMTVISAIASSHKDMAFFGGNVRFYGCFSIISCVVIFLMTYGYIRTESFIQLTVTAFIVGACIIGLMGTLQLFGIEPLEFPPVKGIIMILIPGGSDMDVGYIQRESTASLFNPNYVGSYAPLVLPVCVYGIIRLKGTIWRVIAAITTLLMAVTLYGSYSDAGRVAAIAGVGALVVLLLPYMKKTVRVILIVVGIVLVVAAAYVLWIGGVADNLLHTDDSHIIRNMKTREYGVDMSLYDGSELSIDLDAETMAVPGWSETVSLKDMLTVTDKNTGEELLLERRDATGEELASMVAEESLSSPDELPVYYRSRYVLRSDGYPPIEFYCDAGRLIESATIDGNSYMYDRFHVVDGEFGWSFLDAGGGFLHYINEYTQKSGPLDDVERYGFEGHYGSASGRGYIWACTLPLLKKHVFVGAGPDNFIFDFPNDDFVGMKYWGYNQIYLANPHDMYLLMWDEEGLIALLAFLFIYALFIIRAVRMCYRKRDKDSLATRISYAEGVVIVAAVGTTAYMVAGLANDYMVCVAPVYYVLLGLGYAAEMVFYTASRKV